MHADLDALLTVLYVLVDDLLPRGQRRRGRRPRISDSELICLAVAQVSPPGFRGDGFDWFPTFIKRLFRRTYRLA